MERPIAILFDIDGTLITTGGAGAVAWRLAFEELYGIPADIGMFSDAGMTDPEVGRKTFSAVIGHEPGPRELARVMAMRLKYLPQAVAESKGYRVLDGVEELLPRLVDEGYLLRARQPRALVHVRRLRLRLDRPYRAHPEGDRSRRHAARDGGRPAAGARRR